MANNARRARDEGRHTAGSSLRAAPVVRQSACLLLLFVVSPRADAAGQLVRDVAFTKYSVHASNPELFRRTLSPLTAARLQKDLARSGKSLAGQPLNLAEERYAMYVPAQRPAKGYGLVVFVPPWDAAPLPAGWADVLDRNGMIFVSAARSGNDASVLARREPLALLAVRNIGQQYPVDPDRTYIAGFSGGSRIALRLALGYPDVFRGAILNAGSDPIGTAEIPLPPGELFAQFRDRTRLVLVTGERDQDHANEDLLSLRSLRERCVFDIDSFLELRIGHDVAPAAEFARAVARLMEHATPDPCRLSACRSAVERTLDLELRAVESSISSGRTEQAQKRLKGVDDRFGCLATPRSVDLASKL